MDVQQAAMYKDRFENLFRVARKVSASLNIGDILETIRDEAKIMIPHAKEACLILVDPEAPSYTPPLPLLGQEGQCQLPPVQTR